MEQLKEDSSKESDRSLRATQRTVVTTVSGPGRVELDGVGDGLFYDASDSVGRISSTKSRLDNAQEDLSNYRRRIDANVEHQREHSVMMAALQRKVQEYRRRFADIEGKLVLSKSEEPITFNISEIPDVKYKDELKWNSKMMRGLDDAMEMQIVAALNDERRRNEEFRSQLDQERLQNEQLQAEIQRLRQQFEANMLSKEKIYQNRERNLAQYLSEEQKKMMDLWVELQAVRKQCAEYKEQTERDLENQKNEFTKVMRNVGGVARQLNLTVERGGAHPFYSETSSENGDIMIAEAVKRFREQQAGIPGTGDSELYSELLKKYEESIERIIELESRGDDGSLKTAALEAELKRAREQLAEHQDVLRKLHKLAKESSPEVEKRTRSLSPDSHSQLLPSEVLRVVRYALRTRETEIEELRRQLKNSELQINELTSNNEAAENLRRRLEKQLADAKREIFNQMQSLDEVNREIRRLGERIPEIEAERNAAENARKLLEDEVHRLKELLKEAPGDEERKALEIAEERNRTLEKEIENRVNELNRRIESLTEENKRLKAGMNGSKDKLRTLETEYKSVLRKLDERDSALKQLESVKRALSKELDDQRARFDAVTSEFDHLQSNFDNANKSTVAIEMTVKEIKQQRDEYIRQKEEVTRQLIDIKNKMDEEIKAKEDAEKSNQRRINEIDQLKVQISEYEKQLILLRRHNEELDTQTKTGQAKLTTLENNLVGNQKEIEKLSDLIKRLQREKQEILSLKTKNDTEMDNLKDKIRKLEQEIDKLKKENTRLQESEDDAKQGYKEQVNKVFHLQKELEDAKEEIEELRRRFQKVDDELKERLEYTISLKSAPDTGRDITTYESGQIHEIRVKELEDKWKLDVERLEGERDALDRRIRGLEDELAEKQRIIEEQERITDHLKRENDNAMERVKTELAALKNKYDLDMEDLKDQYDKELLTLRTVETDLRSRLTITEKKLDDAKEKLDELEKDKNDWQDKWSSINIQLQKVNDDLNTCRINSDKEIQKWKLEASTARSDLKTMETSMDGLKTQLTAANDRITTLNKNINEQGSKNWELSVQIRRLEEALTDEKALSATHEADLDSTTARLHGLEDQYSTLQHENDKIRGDLENLQRENDLLKSTNTTLDAELDKLKKKLQQTTVTVKEQTVVYEEVRTERDQLQSVLRKKEAQIDQLTQAVGTFEARLIRMRQELQDATDKLFTADSEKTALRAELNRLQQELQFIKEQTHRKTDEYQSALEDLANAHRTSEDGRVNAVHELESRKFEINDLQTRLDNAEQRLVTLQQEYFNTDNEKELLAEALRRFQSVTNRALAVSRFQQIIKAKAEGGTEEIILEHPEDVVPTAENIQVVPSKKEALDIHGIDINLQKLISRIERLERERNEYRDSLNRMKRRTSDSHITINKQETRYLTIEEKYANAEDERRLIEQRLNSAKQLVLSQEEALKQRDEERRQLKSKMVTMELEARGKDAQIRHLNEQLKKLKADLETSYLDVRSLREREQQLHVSRYTLETRVRDDTDTQRINVLMANFDIERQALSESVKKLNAQLRQSEDKCVDMRDDIERLKRELNKSENNEADLKRNLEQQTRIASEVPSLRDQLSSAQNDISSANNRKQQLESELMNLRSELRDQKQRVQDSASRINEFQRQLQDAQNEKSRLNDKIISLEKTISSQRSTESDLRQQLSTAISERRSVQIEIDELHRRIAQLENDRRAFNDKIDELGRQRAALLKKIELLENERRNAEAIINETALQREAIEHSLTAMESENKELHRNCAQLQQQIAQLEMDSGNRLVQLTTKQREEHEKFVEAVINEKTHVERIIESRDRAQRNRLQQLEEQVNMLRNQLNNERRRRRDITERMLATDFTKRKIIGTPAVSTFSPISYPQTDSFEYVIGSHKTDTSFGSYELSDVQDYPNYSNYTTITLKDPDTTHEVYKSSLEMPGKSEESDEKMGVLKRSDEIEESGKQRKGEEEDGDRSPHEGSKEH